MSLQPKIITVTPQRESVQLHKRSFHMDRGKIVCNGCGGHFPNLLLFENHTHGEDQKANNMPSRKSGPKSDNRTFNTMSDNEMMEAFHKMPELEGCWYTHGQYHCNMCGKGFPNPYILFSHKIVHPEDMTPMKKGKEREVDTRRKEVDPHHKEVGTHTTKGRKQVPGDNCKHNVIIPRVFNERSGSCSDDSDDVRGDVTLTTLKVPQNSENEAHVSTHIRFVNDSEDDADKVQSLGQVPNMPAKKLKEMKSGNNVAKSKKDHFYKWCRGGKGRSTSVKSKPLSEHIVMVDPVKKMESVIEGDRRRQRQETNPGCEKGLVFTDLDDDKKMKAFHSLPGLQNCTMEAPGIFRCDKCSRTYENPYLLFTHRLTHKEVVENQIIDSSAGDAASANTNLVFYSLPGLNECKMVNGKYQCDICPAICNNPYLLFTHKMSHDTEVKGKQNRHMNEKLQSPGIGHVFGQNFLHNCKIMNGKYYCNECPKLYSSPYLLLNHKLYHERYETKTCDAQVGTTDEDEEDSMCFECNLCQVKFDTMDGLADHIEAHAADTQVGTSCTFSDNVLADVSKASTSACSMEMADDTMVVKVKEEPITDYEGVSNTMEPRCGSPGIDPSVKIKLEPSDLPQHFTENRVRAHIDVPLAAKLFLKRTHFSPVVRLKRIKLEPNETYIVK